MERWVRMRDEARATVKPDGFVLETSFSSHQPMHGWTAAHAIRELWQNLRDGVASVFGGADEGLTPTFSEASGELAGRIALSVKGGDVGSVDATAKNSLVFRQRYGVLQPKHLALASVKTGSAAGAHGEGL
jgi:hypothetical protein